MVPKILFFFGAFMVLFLLFKLGAFAKAAVAALILGKVVPLLDWGQSGRRFDAQRRIVVITGKTVIYALVVLVLGTGERLFEAYRTARTLGGGFSLLKSEASLPHFLGMVLLISLVVGAYLTIEEIDQALGKGTLLRILFARPKTQPLKDHPG